MTAMTKSFLQSVLQPSLVQLTLNAARKDEAIKALLDIPDRQGLLKNRQEAERVVFERERAMSTGMEQGIAIPHGKTDTVDKLLVAVALKPEGLEFSALDGQPSRIFILVLSPLASTGPHLRFMAEISKILRRAEVRDAVLKAADPQALVDILVNAAI